MTVGVLLEPSPKGWSLFPPSPANPLFLLPSQIDLLIQETSRLLQLTIEHDPHEMLESSPLSELRSPLRSPSRTPCPEPAAIRQRSVM